MWVYSKKKKMCEDVNEKIFFFNGLQNLCFYNEKYLALHDLSYIDEFSIFVRAAKHALSARIIKIIIA